MVINKFGNGLGSASRIALGTAILAGVLALPAQAQDSQDPGADERDQGLSNVIIVTAQKREQDISEVTTAVSAVSGEELTARDVTDFIDIESVVPSVRITGEGANGSVAIRGIGTSVYTTSAEAAVLTVVDDLAVLQAGQAFDALSDIERVEVLRGPQGTLFGKGASAGVVNIVTRGPSDQFEADFSSQIVDDGRFNVQMGAGGPIAENIGIRVSGYYNKDDGIITNRVTGNELGGREGFGFRTKLRIEPIDLLTVDINYSHAEQESIGAPSTLRFVPANAILPFGVNLNDFLFGITPGPDNREVAYNVDGYLRTNTDTISLRGEYDLGFASVISITGYQDWRNDILQDLDLTAAPVFGSPVGIVQGGPYHSKLFSQELRLVSDGSGPLNYLIGAYYADGSTDRAFLRTPGTPLASNIDSNAGTTTKAIFAEATYMFPTRTEVTAGIRYNHEQITAELINFLPSTGNPANDIQTCRVLCSGENSDDAVTYRLAVRQELTPDVSVYASYATGYKGAAFDISSSFSATKAANPALPENVDSYEIGVRGSVLEGIAQIALTGFWTDYDNFQQQALVIANDPTQPTENRLTNVGALRTRGIEFEARINPFNGMQLAGYVTYIDAEIEEFPFGPCFAGQTVSQGCLDPDGPGGRDPFQDLAGGRLNGVSDWTYNIFARYDFDLQSAPFDPFVQVDYSYRSSVLGNISQDPNSITEGYDLLDLSFGVRLHEPDITATVFVNNVLDDTYLSGAFAGAFTPSTVLANAVRRDQQRVFGFRVSGHF